MPDYKGIALVVVALAEDGVDEVFGRVLAGEDGPGEDGVGGGVGAGDAEVV
ncbi:hypothetical protein V495_03441, partial [Pseudogymnoascus sp. VKM F-4514 (FW-929)]